MCLRLNHTEFLECKVGDSCVLALLVERCDAEFSALSRYHWTGLGGVQTGFMMMVSWKL